MGERIVDIVDRVERLPGHDVVKIVDRVEKIADEVSGLPIAELRATLAKARAVDQHNTDALAIAGQVENVQIASISSRIDEMSEAMVQVPRLGNNVETIERVLSSIMNKTEDHDEKIKRVVRK